MKIYSLLEKKEMSKLLLILLCLPFLFYSCDYETKKVQDVEKIDVITYKRGYGPKLIGEVYDGNRIIEKYSNDTILNYEHIYVNGKLDSSTAWYGTGKLWSKTQYKDGVRHGNHIVYNEDGTTLKYVQIYNNDSLISNEKIQY